MSTPNKPLTKHHYVVIIEDHDQQTLDCGRVEATSPVEAVILHSHDYLRGFNPRAYKVQGIWQYKGTDGKGVTDNYRVTVLRSE